MPTGAQSTRLGPGSFAGSALAKALGSDLKGKLSVAAYAVSIGLAWVEPIVSVAIWVAVAIIWLVPETRGRPLPE